MSDVSRVIADLTDEELDQLAEELQTRSRRKARKQEVRRRMSDLESEMKLLQEELDSYEPKTKN